MDFVVAFAQLFLSFVHVPPGHLRRRMGWSVREVQKRMSMGESWPDLWIDGPSSVSVELSAAVGRQRGGLVRKRVGLCSRALGMCGRRLFVGVASILSRGECLARSPQEYGYPWHLQWVSGFRAPVLRCSLSAHPRGAIPGACAKSPTGSSGNRDRSGGARQIPSPKVGGATSSRSARSVFDLAIEVPLAKSSTLFWRIRPR